MATRLAENHIAAHGRLQELVSDRVGRAWDALGSYDRADVRRFLQFAVPLVLAGQRQSVALTEAYLAAFLGRAPKGIDPAKLTGAAVRNGTEPTETYTRPFVTVWTSLKAGQQYEDAVNAGLARAQSTAAMDIQLSQRETLRAVGEADRTIMGFQRVINAGACEYCQSLSGAQFLKQDPMPIHPACRCSAEPVEYTRGRSFKPSPKPSDVTVHDHGELGPLLGGADHDFTTL